MSQTSPASAWYHRRPELFLTLLTILALVGPISIDVFSPSLPAIGQAFGATQAMTQMSVTLFMLGFSISMLICGPLADSLGRRKTLLIGYTVFMLSTAVLLFTDDMMVFLIARLFQAIFGCFGTALSRAIANDLFEDKQQVKILAMIGACLTAGPMIAPAVGGVVEQSFGWEYNIILMGGFGLLALLGVMFLIPETLKQTQPLQLKNMVSGYGQLLTDGTYMRHVVAAGLAFSGAFVFVAGAPFALIEQMELAPTTYGILFGLIMATFIASSAMASKLEAKLGRSKLLFIASILLVAGAAVAVIGGLNEETALVSLIGGMMIYEIGLGQFLPCCQARAMRHLPENLGGTGAGLIFFMEMIMATLVAFLTPLLPLEGTLPVAALMLGAGLIAALCIRIRAVDDTAASAQTA
ncbi:multidrug effflux MFS transporter [Spongorhabdus nitratireducens]